MRDIRLEFLRNEADEEEGLNHPGIETYRGSPYSSIARECGQNSSDARIATPARLSFDLIKVMREDNPFHAQLSDAANACYVRAKDRRDTKEIDFFKRALLALSKPDMNVLRISDYNTTGLVGPSSPGHPFHTLVKGVGVSSGKLDTSGGSYGIGKFAAFACSDLQTVFYVTLYKEEGSEKEEFLAQGKTILRSHTDALGNNWKASGYWGRSNHKPIEVPAELPDWMQRAEVGASLFLVAFRESPDWHLRIAASVLQNFFRAIQQKLLQFDINNGEISINSETLPVFFRDPAISRVVDKQDQREDFDFSRTLFECLTSPASVSTEYEVGSLGRVLIRVLVREGLPKRICIIRNGMVITDNLAAFGDKFSSFPLYKDFVALVEPLDAAGSAIIKHLENPRHDNLSAERLSDENKKAESIRDMKRLARVVRGAIKDLALPKLSSRMSIDELTEFFSERSSAEPPQLGGDDDPETFRYERGTPRPIKPVTRQPSTGAGTSGGAGDKGHGGGGGSTGAGSGYRRGSGTGGEGMKAKPKVLELLDFRNALERTGGKWDRRLFFTPTMTGRVALTVYANGLDSEERIPILDSDVGTSNSGSLVLAVTADTRLQVRVKLAEPYIGPIELQVALEEGVGS